MNRLKLIRWSFMVMAATWWKFQIVAQQPAFPGAEGFGRYTTGGRGGTVYEVKNLSDAGAGSLRYGIESLSGPRTIVFRVSGTIELTNVLKISGTHGDLTIAGQTAPGDGITLSNYSFQVDADNVIIRYIRSRMGDAAAYEGDAMWGRRRKNIIIDHCSLSWSTDECGSFYDNQDFTLQWCILSESLRVSIHEKGTHGYGGIWGGQKVSFHHNLLAHHDSRNPRFCGSRYTDRADLELVDFRNNVIYNWGGNSGYAGEGGRYNMVNNYYKPGPATRSSVQTRIFAPNADDGSNAQAAGIWGKFYVDGNYMNNSTPVTNDNWLGIFPNPDTKSKSELMSRTEYEKGFIVTSPALNAYDNVLAYAGASVKRDTVDKRIIMETSNGTYTYTGSNGSTNGLIDTQSDVGGWPVLNSLPAPVDSDHDGMPDDWENDNGLNPNLDTDRNNVAPDGYTMLEKYLNSLVNWTPAASYDLVTSVTGNGFIAPSLGYYEAGTEVKLVAIPLGGWQFDSWSGDTSGTESTLMLEMNSNKTITANFSEIPSLITEFRDQQTISTYCYPNPVLNQASIVFNLEEPGMVNISLYDVFGKLLKEVLNEYADAGSNETDLDVTGIKPGVYLYSVSVGNETIFNRITIINQ